MTSTAVRRRVKGERRRRALLEAALTLIGRGGPAALTHRALASEAGVPLAATTYYFTSKDELLRETLEATPSTRQPAGRRRSRLGRCRCRA